MTLFSIDSKKCKRDGTCVAECPMQIIELKDKTAVPTPVADAQKLCINCGHCVAVCPYGAFSLTTMPAHECPPIDKKKLPSFQQLDHLIRSRRSVRVYKDKPVSNKTIATLIDTARYAPTGKNTQTIHWLVINGRENTHKLAEMVIDWMRHLINKKDPLAAAFGMKRIVLNWDKGYDGILRGAPALIIAHAPKEYRGALTDSTIALTTLELAAFANGLGTCWAGFFNIAAFIWPPLQAALDLPTGHGNFGAMMIGHAKHSFHRQPKRLEARITWR